MSAKSKAAAGAAALLFALAGTYTLSDRGVTVLKEQEGTSTAAYYDPVGIPTICHGHVNGVFIGQHATIEECDSMLREDAGFAGAAIAKKVQVRLTQEQYDALALFVYNVGAPKFYGSTLLRKLNAGDCWGAGREFARWVYAKGRKLRGLVKRRAVERQMFESGCSADPAYWNNLYDSAASHSAP